MKNTKIFAISNLALLLSCFSFPSFGNLPISVKWINNSGHHVTVKHVEESCIDNIGDGKIVPGGSLNLGFKRMLFEDGCGARNAWIKYTVTAQTQAPPVPPIKLLDCSIDVMCSGGFCQLQPYVEKIDKTLCPYGYKINGQNLEVNIPAPPRGKK